jgi:hypothetical protein
MMSDQPESQISRIANEYFSLLARAFPVMCASDEFHFLPRVQEAVRFLDSMDELSQETIGAVVVSVRDLQNQLEKQPAAEDFEEEVDRQLLLHNMAGLLIELEEVKSWRSNPLLYLKVGCIGVDHALNKPYQDEEERLGRTAERLSGLKKLLNEGSKNLSTIPGPYFRVALAVVQDAQKYLDEILFEFDGHSRREQLALPCAVAQEALLAFGSRLREIGPTPAAAVQSVSVEDLLQRHFGCTRSLEEIYSIAEEEWQNSQEEMERLDWQQIYESYVPRGDGEFDLFKLYGNEIEALRELCQELELLDDHLDQEVVLAETPTYLRSVRSLASYYAPLGSDPHEQALFYITTARLHKNSKSDVSRLKHLHRDYQVVTAHETYPGHHLLDCVRRSLDNPIRRQIDSALFYEGWAFYAESILSEKGYFKLPIEELVACRYRLWRAARCLIDVGLAMERLTMEEAASLLVSVGHETNEAISQVERYRLSPGYQICYTLGKHEILELRQQFVPQLGWQKFHRLLMEGGQVPFQLASRRFQNMIDLVR